jgi:hypothetical protein
MREVEGVQVDLDAIAESLPQADGLSVCAEIPVRLECTTLAGLVLQGAHHLAKWVPISVRETLYRVETSYSI